MKHLGDITKISGATAPRVEVVIGGSPCQDLSVAGKRSGLAGKRSGLFMEQIRIVKEARERDESVGLSGSDVYPRYMVWENVPGAFSSNKGEDFRAVLEETVRIIEPNAIIPKYEGGAWRLSGVIMGDGWSIAWRVHDAQFFGVPQRRRRICMVADFGGETAPWIVFDLLRGASLYTGSDLAVGGFGGGSKSEVHFISERLSRDFEEIGKPRKRITSDSQRGTYPSVVGTLKARMDGSPMPERASGAPVICVQGNCIDRADHAGCNGRGWNDEDVSYTLNTIDRPAVCAPVFVENHPNDSRVKFSEDGYCQTLSGRMGTGGNNTPLVFCIGNGQADNTKLHEKAPALSTMHDQQAVMTSSVVRRLTPLECERLQGYPDGWTDIGEWTDSKGKKHKTSDAVRYKALGNSIALPYWSQMLRRMIRFCKSRTMASLFDGIGGFPLCWYWAGGTTLWASEIEEFPIAVTKLRFGE